MMPLSLLCVCVCVVTVLGVELFILDRQDDVLFYGTYDLSQHLLRAAVTSVAFFVRVQRSVTKYSNL